MVARTSRLTSSGARRKVHLSPNGELCDVLWYLDKHMPHGDAQARDVFEPHRSPVMLKIPISLLLFDKQNAVTF
jgi:hypothetical protein